MLGWRGIFRMENVWERNMPFWRCLPSHDVPLSIIQLLITKFMVHMLRMHIEDNQKIDIYYRYIP